MVKPVRLQLSRRKGFDLQSVSLATNGLHAVNVARPSKWGNPFRKDTFFKRFSAEEVVARFRDLALVDMAPGARHADYFNLASLRGKNLACWCSMDGSPCHADVLLALANAPICEAV